MGKKRKLFFRNLPLSVSQAGPGLLPPCRRAPGAFFPLGIGNREMVLPQQFLQVPLLALRHGLALQFRCSLQNSFMAAHHTGTSIGNWTVTLPPHRKHSAVIPSCLATTQSWRLAVMVQSVKMQHEHAPTLVNCSASLGKYNLASSG